MSSIWVVWNGTKHAAGESVCEGWGGNPATSQPLCRSLGGWCALTEAGGHAAGLDAAAWGCTSRARTRCHVMGTSPWARSDTQASPCNVIPSTCTNAGSATHVLPAPTEHPPLCIPFRVGNTDQKKGRSCRAGSCVLGRDWTAICPPSGHLWGSPQHMNAMVECCSWTGKQRLPYYGASPTEKE